MDLVADIGATNARFQYCLAGELQGQPVVLPTADFDEARTLLSQALTTLGGGEPRKALLAVAGPVTDKQAVEITNTGLQINVADAGSALGCPTSLANDFYALAHGVPYFTQLEQIGGGPPLQATKALLGPGTGLGMATLVRSEHVAPAAHWQVVASEGGHADLAPGTHLEAELWGVLMEEHGHVCWETVLCGSGMQHLYAAMCALWGMRAGDLAPADIVTYGQDMSDPVCHQTLETFCALLGAVASNLAVTVTARGGVYVGGGIIGRMLDFVRNSPLRRRFEERGAMRGLVEDIPILVITEQQPGLMGAARCLHEKSLHEKSLHLDKPQAD